MISIKDFKPRIYQETILNTAKDKNTLVVLPTGLGKSYIFLLLGIHRLSLFPNSKILLCSPTKPLTNQLYEVFKKHTDIKEEDIVLLTGAINPEKRTDLWKNAKVIMATPQTIQFDLENNRISLEDVTLLTLDEAHRSRMRYANTIVAKYYMQQAEFPRILALTASPGGTKEKIKEICKNLFIENIEIRTEEDEDVEPYIKKRNINWIDIELPFEFKEIRELIKKVYSEKIKSLKKFGITKPSHLINKRDLLNLQIEFSKRINKGDKTAFAGISMVAQALKLSHALELLETQSLGSFKKFLDKLQKEETRAARIIMNDKNITKANILTQKLIENKVEHPKMSKLCEIVKDELTKDPNSKIIIFANFRDTVREIVKILMNVSKAKPIELLGQKEGITQKKQIQTIEDYEEGVYNCLCTSSIGEEGIDIKGGAELAIFYDMVGSEIRKIQRTGRVGRTKPGKIIFLLTKSSRDQAYYWSAYKKEKTMKYILKEAQNKNLIEQTNLEKF